jgi:hypothetical protein
MLEPQTAAQVTIVESRLSVTGLKLLSTEQEESDRRKKRAAPLKPLGASVKAVLLPEGVKPKLTQAPVARRPGVFCEMWTCGNCRFRSKMHPTVPPNL